ncbi:MAG TPA: OmpH family outer membrane protein [Pelobium sp.]
MKKYIILPILIVMFCLTANAQRLAVVDSEYILKHIPEYSSAQKQLNASAQKWQSDIDAKFVEVEKMRKDFQADQVLLTDDMKKTRENDILKKEKEANDLQQQKFGYQGELYKEKLRLIKPIQDKVAKAVESYADAESVDMVLDKSTVALLFARPNFDVTNEVIEKLGYKPGAFAK